MSLEFVLWFQVGDMVETPSYKRCVVKLGTSEAVEVMMWGDCAAANSNLTGIVTVKAVIVDNMGKLPSTASSIVEVGNLVYL